MIYKLGAPVHKTRILRHVTKPLPISKYYTYPAHVFLGNYGHPEDMVVEHSEEQITYTNSRKGDRRKANYCMHSKVWTATSTDPTDTQMIYSPNPVPNTVYEDHEWAWYGELGHTTARPIFEAAISSQGWHRPEALLGLAGQGWINDAYDRITPNLTKMSLPNFLWEIAQLKGLIKIWNAKLHSQGGSQLSRVLKSSAKGLAGARLNYKYGWLPTLGDLSGMIEAMAVLRNKLKQFKALQGIRIKDSVKLFEKTYTANGTIPLIGSLVHTPWDGKVTHTVRGYVEYTPQGITVLNKYDELFRGVADSLGVELNPRIIWDAIPFSFVVDNFLSVGKWLDTFRVDALELPVSLDDSYLQFKSTFELNSSTYNDDPNHTAISRSPPWKTTESFFHRLPLKPDYATLASLNWKGPSVDKVINLISLATVLRKF
jgi:hypothetical protein